MCVLQRPHMEVGTASRRKEVQDRKDFHRPARRGGGSDQSDDPPPPASSTKVHFFRLLIPVS